MSYGERSRSDARCQKCGRAGKEKSEEEGKRGVGPNAPGLCNLHLFISFVYIYIMIHPILKEQNHTNASNFQAI